MKVLKLCYEFPPIGGGGAKIAASLIEQITAAGHEVDLVTMAYGNTPRQECRGKLTIYRIPCARRRTEICHPHEMLIYIARALPLVVSLARKNRYDLNHTHFIFPDGVLGYLLARTVSLPYLVTVHGSDVPGYNPDRFKLLHTLLHPLWGRVARNANSIICPSQYIRRLLLQVDPCVRCEVIPNGIDTTRFSPRARGDRQRRVLVISRLLERKGVQFLLHSLRGLEHDYEVCIVGDGPYLKTLRGIAKDNRIAVNFLGFIGNETPKFRELLETSEIFVFTSCSENFPVVLLEAMSAGLSIVTTDATGCREVVGDAAVKVPPEDAPAIRQALLKLMGDDELRRRLGKAARKRVEALFTQRAVADQYHRIYRRCIAANSASSHS